MRGFSPETTFAFIFSTSMHTVRDINPSSNVCLEPNLLEKPSFGQGGLLPDCRDIVALVVEDEPLLLMELADALADIGLTVFEADGPIGAIQHLQHRPRIDLMVTDIRINHDVDGWALARMARSHNPDVKVIYATANQCLKNEMVPGAVYIGKPYDMAEIRSTAKTLLLD